MYSFCLDEAAPDDHLVRAIAEFRDMSRVHAALARYYPKLGRPPIDPVLMIRILIVYQDYSWLGTAIEVPPGRVKSVANLRIAVRFN